MKIEAGKKYRCREEGLTATIIRWDADYGVWVGKLHSYGTTDTFWYKNGRFKCAFGMTFAQDLVEEIRPTPRTFYINEYVNENDGTVLHGPVYYSPEDAAMSRSYKSCRKTLKLIEVLE